MTTSEPRWHWRNCRSIGVKIELWLWPWIFGAFREDDVYGGHMGLHLGPISVGLGYSIGNNSSTGLDRFTGLSEAEAYERAERFEGKSHG